MNNEGYVYCTLWPGLLQCSPFMLVLIGTILESVMRMALLII